MDLEELPSRFQDHFRPRRYCTSILRGGLCWRGSSCTFALVRRAPLGCTGTTVMVVPVIMQLEFQQSVLFFSLKVPQFQFMICVLCWFHKSRYTLFCVPLSVGRPVMPGIMVGMFIVETIAGVPWVARCCARCAQRLCQGLCRCEYAATSSSSPF